MTPKIEEPLYVEYKPKAKKWQLVGMYSEKCYGKYGSKNEAYEQFRLIMGKK